MLRPFAITSDNTVRLDDKGQGEITITVTNSSGAPLRGRIRLSPLQSAQEGWFSVTGEAERDFPVDGTHQFTVRVSVPAGTPVGKYGFRPDVHSVVNPDEQFTEGQQVSIEVKPSEPPPKPFPMWIIPVIVGVLLVVGVVVFLVLRPRGPEPLPANNGTSTPDSVVAVPQLVGQPLEQAIALLNDAKLAPENAGFTGSGPGNPGEVATQSIAAGTRVVEGTAVSFQVKGVLVPGVTGSQLFQAVLAIQNRQLTVGTVTQRAVVGGDESVTAQSPAADTPVAKGSPVNLTVSVQRRLPNPWELFSPVERRRIDPRIFE